MTQLKITHAAFNNLSIYFGGQGLSEKELSQSNMFFPILLILLEKTLTNKAMLDDIVTFDLIFNKKSFFYVEATNVDIKRADVFINILNEMKGIQFLLPLFNELEDDFLEKNRYDLVDFFSNIREKVLDSLNLNGGDIRSTLNRVFDYIKMPLLSAKFINKQKKHLSGEEAFVVSSPAENNLKNKVRKPFLLTETYPQLNGEDKKIFNELAVLASAMYLSKTPKKNAIVDIAELEALPVDEITLLAGIINHRQILEAFAIHFNCQSYQIIFNSEVYLLREKLKLTATTRTIEVNNCTTNWYQFAKGFAVNLQLNAAVNDCFSASIENEQFNIDSFVNAIVAHESPQIKMFVEMNQHGNKIVKTAITSEKIKKELNRIVIGQDAAVSSLCQGYLSSSIEAPQGPRLIYTFAGPSGVGKTYLASQLQLQLNQFEKSGYAFSVFNMEQYSNERDAMKLFGSGVQYTDASLGMLTSEVRAQPRQVLLFDEVEKAHSITLQSLLSILDSGIAKDETSREEIDFSQCIVIFTTNLGQETLQNTPQHSSVSVFDLLRHAENPSNNTKLSPEFINRLAKGFPILFSELKVNHLLRLAEMQVSKVEPSSSYVAYNWPDNFSSLMLQSMSPDISVRALKSNFSKHKSLILSRAIPYLLESTQDIEFQVSIEQVEINIDKRSTQLLLLDDDSRVFDQVKEHPSKCNVSLCEDVDKLHHAIESFHPDALLIDIEALNKNHIPLPQIISKIFERNHKTAIFTYCLVGSTANLREQSFAHEVREHFNIQLDDFSSAFTAMLSRVDYYIETERKLFNMKRKNEQLQYQCEVINQDGIFHATYKALSVCQLIQSVDLKEGDLFKCTLPALKLDDVIGLERAKKRLVEVVSWLKSPEKLANFGVKVPSGFLFAGPPGTGKTFLAKALAGESGLPFFNVSSSDLSDKYAGGATKKIKKLFATARKYAPAIIFIDEIDAIAGKRSSSTSSLARDNNATVNALLTEMDGFTPESDPIFILAATNYPQLLDSAIVRPGRFDETIYCDLPNAEARKQFFTRFSSKHQITFSEDELKQLVSSSQGMSSAEIEQVFRESIYQAIGDNTPLTSEDIKQTMIRVSYGLPSDHIVLSAEEKRRTAYHEAGHLLLTKLLFPKQPIDFVTIEPRSNALGFVATRAADEYESLSSSRVKHRLEVLLAGRVAEKIYTKSVDEVSSGAASDIEKATELAMHVIYEGGLEPSVGPVNVGLLTKYEESDLLLKAQDAVQSWLLNAEKSAETRLIKHRSQLDHIANTLIEKESLIRSEIEDLFL